PRGPVRRASSGSNWNAPYDQCAVSGTGLTASVTIGLYPPRASSNPTFPELLFSADCRRCFSLLGRTSGRVVRVWNGRWASSKPSGENVRAAERSWRVRRFGRQAGRSYRVGGPYAD